MVIANKKELKILVDADAFPFKEQVAEIAKEHNIKAIFVTSVCHFSATSTIEYVVVDNLPQAADMAIINNLQAGDIVITQDFGLAALALGKGGYAISPRGMLYENDNIDELMFQRHLAAAIRRSGGKTKGPSKMRPDDKISFLHNLERLIVKALDNTSSP